MTQATATGRRGTLLCTLLVVLLLASPGATVAGTSLNVDVLASGGGSVESSLYHLQDSFAQCIQGPSGAGAALTLDDGLLEVIPWNPQPGYCWLLELTVCNEDSGEHALGTDGFDVGLDEIIPPPGFTFYSYFQEPPPFPYLSKSIKFCETEGERSWLLSIVNSAEFSVWWDPESLPPPQEYQMSIAGVDMFSTDHLSLPYAQTLQILVNPGTGVVEETAAPQALRILSTRPNPFNPTTEIAFAVPEQETVTLEVFDVSGRSVAILKQGAVGPGTHRCVWNGTDRNGRRVASGVYLLSLRSRSESDHGKLVLLK